ncbi:MAG: hypothetical protein NWF05_00335 [Candidatus Bathyarchaeota archaeon]|nr:hypothetical protein [Candidatus Bathyarchaeota archaeon]
MVHRDFYLPLKTGLLLVSVAWFTYTLFQFVSGVIHANNQPWFIMVTDTLGTVGLGFRTAASFAAVIALTSYFFTRSMGKAEALMSLRWIILFEAAYYLVTFIPSAFWGVGDNPFSTAYGPLLGNLVVNFIPCIVEGVLMPVVLVKFFLALNPNKPSSKAITWGLISATAYLLVFWISYLGNWLYTAITITEGIDYVILPLNLLSFLLTTVGLLILTLYAAYFTKKSAGTESWRKLDMRKIGAVATAFGLYFDAIYLMWIYFDSVGGWSPWYAWFLGHNVDLWLLILPLAGLPLLFYKKPTD